MFEYNQDLKTKELYVRLPFQLDYNYIFLNSMARLIKCVVSDEVTCVLLSCAENAEYEKLCKAFILNVLHSFVALGKTVKWTSELKHLIEGTVTQKEGSEFEFIAEASEIIANNELVYYDFSREDSVEKPVKEIARVLVEKSLTINAAQIQEFLATTIGEIFSNSFNHSERDEVFLMYEVFYKDGAYYLCVSIIDYGTTIIANVKKYIEKKKSIEMDSVSCIKWAIQQGNTTMEKSGGYGLSTLILYIENISGELFIFSGDAVLKIQGDERQIERAEGVFLGTSVTFKVKLRDLDKAIPDDTVTEKLVNIGLESI